MKTRNLILFLIIGLNLAGCVKRIPYEPKKTGIEGRVVHYDRLLESAYVYAFGDPDFTKEPLYISMPTDDNGHYDFEMPAGRYFVIAKKDNYFSYFGGNPITIMKNEYPWVGLNCINKEPEDLVISSNENEEVILEGQVTYQGKPVDGAYVYLYLDDKTDFKGLGFQASLPTDKDGKFKFVNLPEGKYCLVARKRTSAVSSGPILLGDYYGYFAYNPVTLKWGNRTQINLKCIRRAGEIGKEILSIGSGDTIIRGKILDSKRIPLKGVYAFLYLTPVIGHERPVYISNVTDESGEFEIRIKTGGKYYLGARQVYGDSPRPGELYGLYDKTLDHSIVIKSGEIKEKVNLFVNPILNP